MRFVNRTDTYETLVPGVALYDPHFGTFLLISSTPGLRADSLSLIWLFVSNHNGRLKIVLEDHIRTSRPSKDFKIFFHDEQVTKRS